MSEYDTMKDYLIKLGFRIDPAQYQNFNNIINTSTRTVQKMATSWETSVKVGAAGIVGSLGSIAAGTVAVLDSVSKADLGYKLFAMRMFMNEDAAKKMKIATDALGHSMEEIIWNKELSDRYGKLMALQGRLEGNLSGDYAKTMKSLRDIRFEFTKMKVEAVWGMQVLAETIANKFGYSLQEGKEGLENINEIIIRKTPEWAEKVADFLDGIKKSLEPFKNQLGGLTKAINLTMKQINRLSGEGADNVVSFVEKLEWAGYAMAAPIHAFLLLARALYLVSAFSGKGAEKWDEFKKELNESWNDYMEVQRQIAPQGVKDFNWWKPLPTPELVELSKNRPLDFESRRRSMLFNDSASPYAKAAEEVSKRTGISAALIYGQWHHETNGFKDYKVKQLNNLGGVKDRNGDYRRFSSLDEYVDYMSDYLPRRYGKYGIAESQTAQEYAERLKRGGYYEAPLSQYAAGVARGAAQYNVTVNVTQPNATAEEIANRAVSKLEEFERFQTSRQIRQATGPLS